MRQKHLNWLSHFVEFFVFHWYNLFHKNERSKWHGKRDDDRAGVYEWWYFDMILDGEQVIKRSGDMIYEFVYMGTTVKEKMEN